MLATWYYVAGIGTVMNTGGGIKRHDYMPTNKT